MRMRLWITAIVASLWGAAWCQAEDLLFEDAFDKELSARWKVVGLTKEDYRVRNGGLELRARAVKRGDPAPMLKVDLPFTTDDTVIASVEVSVIGEALPRGAYAGLTLTDEDGSVFTVRKTNIDGYFVFAPGEVEFIGQPGQEGDPSNFTVKYWPAKPEAGPLRIILRGPYAHAQVGPSFTGQYKTFFYSAIQEAKAGLGFGLVAIQSPTDGEHWVRFDNFRVRK
ncbi:MAG TPA: hypothetical protein VFG20_07915 [Planctomycetaceae bacterium]|nr:hypothetical protein [Planctomycetaceae bacterium]